MAAAKLIEAHGNGAEKYQGEIAKEQIRKLMKDVISLPIALLPLDELVECGINKSNGFFWMRMTKKTEKKFKSIGTTVLYDVEMAAFFEKFHLWKLTGVKAKEMLIAATVCDILVGSPSPDKIKFTSPVGLSPAHPISAFVVENDGENSGK